MAPKTYAERAAERVAAFKEKMAEGKRQVQASKPAREAKIEERFVKERLYGGGPVPSVSGGAKLPSAPKPVSVGPKQAPTPKSGEAKQKMVERRQVARLTKQGKSEREVAKELKTSRAAVRNHKKKNEDGKETKRGAAISRKGDRLKGWQRKKLEAQKLNEGKKPGEKRHYVSERWSEGGWRHTHYTK